MKTRLLYFVSPMCSWCWGFAPVVQHITQRFGNQVLFQIVLVPFRIDTTEPMQSSLREYILGQWHKVHITTHQPFDFRFAMPEGFIYNTTLVCKAIKAFSQQLPKQEFDYLHAIQSAFYTQNLDVTTENALTELAVKFTIDINTFRKHLFSKTIMNFVQQDFEYTQQLNIQSYPTLLAQHQKKVILLTKGYATFTHLEKQIQTCLRV